MYIIIYQGHALSVIVSDYSEAEEYMINHYGLYDHDELFIEEIDEEEREDMEYYEYMNTIMELEMRDMIHWYPEDNHIPTDAEMEEMARYYREA